MELGKLSNYPDKCPLFHDFLRLVCGFPKLIYGGSSSVDQLFVVLFIMISSEFHGMKVRSYFTLDRPRIQIEGLRIAKVYKQAETLKSREKKDG